MPNGQDAGCPTRLAAIQSVPEFHPKLPTLRTREQRVVEATETSVTVRRVQRPLERATSPAAEASKKKLGMHGMQTPCRRRHVDGAPGVAIVDIRRQWGVFHERVLFQRV